MTVIIGLTGQTGAGKTTVSDLLRARGIPVLDADVLARDVVNNSKSCLGDLVLEFGCDMINHNGELNRRKLAATVFGDRVKLRRLNAITFPHIVMRIREEIETYRAKNAPLLVLDAPTLYEAGCERLCGFVIAVTAPEQERMHRIMVRDDLSVEDAQARMHAQHTDAFFRARADYIIENAGDPAEMEARIRAIFMAALGGTAYEQTNT